MNAIALRIGLSYRPSNVNQGISGPEGLARLSQNLLKNCVSVDSVDGLIAPNNLIPLILSRHITIDVFPSFMFLQSEHD